ncbi:hypothetical protein BHE74_00009786 [Ensete ventricosum]|nr:hypothetical protein BHE74_00009786 [Ensete ventricosum]RZR94520.1 hypothetical protein BHM03_00023213 [Ensete ventricosum]
MSYEHGFAKNAMVINFTQIEFRLIFHASSQNFKIIDIPNVLAQWKSYEHGFMKKRDGHKHYAKTCTKSSFDRFFTHRLKILKY